MTTPLISHKGMGSTTSMGNMDSGDQTHKATCPITVGDEDVVEAEVEAGDEAEARGARRPNDPLKLKVLPLGS